MADLTVRLFRGALDGPADPMVIARLSGTLGVQLPGDYLDFLRSYNGAEGFIGGDFIIFWKAEEIGPLNIAYEVATYAPGFLFFASSGGGEAYAFDIDDPSMPIVTMPFVGMSRQYAIYVAADIEGLFETLGAESVQWQ